MVRVTGAGPTPEFREALLESFAVSERMNQLILTHLDPKAWRAKPAGQAGSAPGGHSNLLCTEPARPAQGPSQPPI